jgi:tetratricopeptide (TPR) repeat protein
MKSICKKYIGYIMLTLLIIILFFEGFFYVFIKQRIVPDLHQEKYNLKNVLRSNLDITLNWFHGYFYPPFRIKTNSKSFLNDQEFKYEKPKNTFRILVLGNSIFMGLGVEGKELFSRNLQSLLNKISTSINFEVINFSGVNWSAVEFLTFLQFEGYKYKPDLVILSEGENAFRVQYNKFLQVNKIESKNKLNGKTEIKLEGLDVNYQEKGFIFNFWQWVRKFPYYLEASKHSQIIHRVRSKLNQLYIKNSSKRNKMNNLDYFFEANQVDINKETIFSLNGDQFLVQPRNHSITYFAKVNNKSFYKANANIALHSAAQLKIAQFLSSFDSRLVAIDIPAEKEVIGVVSKTENQSRKVNTNSKNYFYLNITEIFKEFQRSNIRIPLFYYNNNHLTPAGQRLTSLITYNYLVKNKLIPFEKPLKKIDPLIPKSKVWVKNANERISNYLKTDSRRKFFQTMLYKANGRLELAEQNLIEILEGDKDNFEANYQLGLIYLSAQKYSKAINYFKIASKGGHPLERAKYHYLHRFSVLYSKAIGLQEKNNSEALNILQELEKSSGMFLEKVFYLKARIYNKMKKFNKAESYLIKAIKIRPNFVGYHRSLGNIYFDIKKYTDAISSYKKCIHLDSTDVKSFLMIALSYNHLKKETLGLKWFQKFLGQCGNNCKRILQEANLLTSNSPNVNP